MSNGVVKTEILFIQQLAEKILNISWCGENGNLFDSATC